MDFDKPDIVSVWVGNFTSKKVLDAYVKRDTPPDWDATTPISKFASDWGFISYDTDFQDVVYKSKAMPLKELLTRASYFDSFAVPLCAVFEKQKGELPNSAILVYDFAYKPKGKSAKTNRPVRFLGQFTYKAD